MIPYWRPEVDELVQIPLSRFGEADYDEIARDIGQHRDAALAYAMNTTGPAVGARLRALAEMCRRVGIPTVWTTIEDPNSFGTFVSQAQGFDLICTSDAVLIPQYQEHYPTAKVIWLPLAAQPALHQPAPTNEDAADFVLIANWYEGEARLEGVRTVVEPLVDAGHTLALYAYARCRWPEKYWRWWRGATSCYDVATYYPHGRVALGMNNQAWGTAMCSMRTFEALACGKPFLSFHSDAYERLGFANAGADLRDAGHFVWVRDATDAVRAAENLLTRPEEAEAMAERGREFVLSHHTYTHRLHAIREALGV
jgi:spore maturation protein CgeB